MAGQFAKLKEAVFLLTVWAIVAAGGWLYFNVGHKPPSTPPNPPHPPSTPTNPPNPPSTPPRPRSTDIGFPGYFATFDQLEDRVSEQEEFVKSMQGKKVRWRGYVSYVRNSDVSPSKIALAITPTLSDQLRLAVVYFGQDMRVRLFALREKDPIEVTGTFDSDTWHTPYIRGDSMQLLTTVPTTPPAPAAADR
jgi:hypothetical protein